MLDNLTFTGRELLLAVVLATLVYLVEAWLFSCRRKSAGSPRLEKRIEQLEEAVARLDERLTAQGAGTGVQDAGGYYGEAVRLAQAGLSAGEISQQLGISLTEAELIIALRQAGS